MEKFPHMPKALPPPSVVFENKPGYTRKEPPNLPPDVKKYPCSHKSVNTLQLNFSNFDCGKSQSMATSSYDLYFGIAEEKKTLKKISNLSGIISFERSNDLKVKSLTLPVCICITECFSGKSVILRSSITLSCKKRLVTFRSYPKIKFNYTGSRLRVRLQRTPGYKEQIILCQADTISLTTMLKCSVTTSTWLLWALFNASKRLL